MRTEGPRILGEQFDRTAANDKEFVALLAGRVNDLVLPEMLDPRKSADCPQLEELK